MIPVRIAHWLWGTSPAARIARLPLIPLAGVYWSVMRVRAARPTSPTRLPLPTIAVGNLSVGGTGKTPLAAWIANFCVARRRTPGILLRGYGDDEPLVHQRLAPLAIVVANPNRVAGAADARARGAQLLVLDDAFQLLGVARDLNILVISAESASGSPWPLPAGPWRERWDALRRADLIVVTRKTTSAEEAGALADQVQWRWSRRERKSVCTVSLSMSHLEGMQSGTRRGLEVLAGRRVLAAAGIADPEAFASQLRGAGATVQLMAYQDHHAYRTADLERLVRAAAAGDYVVVTEKDAVKLRPRWPGSAPEPLVATLAVRLERNGPALEQAVDAVLRASSH